CGGRCVPPGYAPAGPPPAGKGGSAARLDWTGNHPRSRAGVRMSAITREQVAHLAKLAHIEMTEEELRSMAKELDLVVDSVASVSEAAGPDVPATSHPIPLQNVFREDVVGETLTAEESLLNAPDAAEGKF